MNTLPPPPSSVLSQEGVWIAIPAYNEERTIHAVAQRALALCPRVLVADDGSTDHTLAALEGLPVTLVRNPVNQGKAAALRSAFEHALRAGARCVVTLDGDGQHDPEDARQLLWAWQGHPECVVIGSRLHDRRQIPPARYHANCFARFWISWAAGHPIADSQSGFRVYPAPVMALVLAGGVRGRGFTFESEVLIEAAEHGHQTLAVAISGSYPGGARTSYFRPVVDIAKIVAMVAVRLLKKGLYPAGLWRSLRPFQVLVPPPDLRPGGSGRTGWTARAWSRAD